MDEKTVTSIEDALMLIMRSFRQSWRGESIFDHAFSRSQKETVLYINQERRVTLKDLAAHLELTSSAATQLVDTLVERDILTRSESSDDRRVVELAFSKNFAPKMEAHCIIHAKLIRELFIDLSEQEIETLSQVAKKVANRTKINSTKLN